MSEELKELNIEIHAGADFALTFDVKDEFYQPVDLTGATIEGQVRQYAEAAEYYPFFINSIPASGIICLTIPFEETQQIGFDKGVYDVFITNADGIREKVLTGDVFVDQAVTRTIEGTMMYRVHVQDYGWLDWVEAGQKCGTEGESKRIEAIEIKLTGELAKYYSVEYCVHIQDYGDMQGWVKDGALAGICRAG